MHVYKLNNNDTLSEVGYYQWNSKTLNASVNTKNIIYNAEDKTISFVAPKLGTYIVLDIKNNYEYQIIEYPDAGNGVSYKMTDSTRWTTNKTSYVLAKYVEDKDIKPISPKIEAVGDIGTAYSVGFTSKNAPYYLATQFSSKQDNTIDVPCYKLELTVPGDTNTKAYFITKDGQMFTPASLGAEQLPCRVSADGKVVITICEATNSETMNIALNRIELMEESIKTDCVASYTGLSDMTGYVLVTDKNIAGMPITKLDGNMTEYKDKYLSGNALVYNGKTQNVSDAIRNTDSDVTFDSPDNMKDAGNYSVTVRASVEKYWADGTLGDKTIDLTIRKKRLKSAYKSESIHVGEEPALKMTSKSLIGWKDNDLKNNLDYQPTLTAPSELKVGYYTLTPELPKLQSDNYYWELVPGTLTVLPEGAELTDQLIEIPTAITGLTYNGKEQTGVADPDENAGYIITGNKGTDAKTYTATATLKDGYWWMDGTKEPKTIEWKIAEKQTNVNPGTQTKTVTANLYVPKEKNPISNQIQAYLTNPDAPGGMVDGKPTGSIPNKPVSDNAEVTISGGKATLELDVVNPVFTLQGICDESEDGKAQIISRDWDKETYGDKTGRITHLTIELSHTSGTHTYVFPDCKEYPTILGYDWSVPLTLTVDFSGGKSDLASGGSVGGTTEVKTDITVKVKDDTATVSKINTDDLSSKNSITLDVTDGNKGVTGVNLPVSALEKIVDAKVPGTTLTLSDTSAKFDLAALTEVTKAASGKTVDLRILTGSDAEKKFSATEKSAMSDVKNASAVSVALSSDDKAITSLGSGRHPQYCVNLCEGVK